MKARSLEIRPILASQWIDRAWPLLEAHRHELTTNPDLMQLEPRRGLYEALDARGVLLSLGLFDGDELVGYSVNIIDHNLHYGSVLVSQNDLLFVHPDYRHGRDGLRLIKATEDAARERGAHMVIWHAKPDTSFDALLPRLGYRVQDVMYSRVF
ncbi:GNAT family N-acetyltransferase [Asticcacaulis sp.]|uniref:GNAT family N-acetyltransferase n=1 Tax=Asticcacaulis sp. TaxID=1872648 RepID=UPI0031DDEE70